MMHKFNQFLYKETARERALARERERERERESESERERQRFVISISLLSEMASAYNMMYKNEIK